MSIGSIKRRWVRRTVVVLCAVPFLVFAAIIGALMCSCEIAHDIRVVWKA